MPFMLCRAVRAAPHVLMFLTRRHADVFAVIFHILYCFFFFTAAARRAHAAQRPIAQLREKAAVAADALPIRRAVTRYRRPTPPCALMPPALPITTTTRVSAATLTAAGFTASVADAHFSLRCGRL